MRTLKKNKQSLKYALFDDLIPIYDYYEDEEGNKIPLETGEYEAGYSKPVPFSANIAMSGGEAEALEYGVSVADYDAVLVLDKDEIPITETSLIWYTSEVGYKDADKTIVDGNTADFTIKAIKPSLNQLKVLLQAVTK